MRSRVLRAKDYRELDVRPLLKPFAPDEAALEAELGRLANPYIRWEPSERVAPGDQAVCRLASDCPRFNKETVRFVAGSGMFHRELEALAVGMTVGETRELDLPEGRVSVTLTGAVSRVVPALTDEMAEKLGLEGVHTLADYRAYLLEQQKEKFMEDALFEPVQYLRDRVLNESEFVLFKEDWQEAVERKLERSRTLCRQEGMVLEEMTAEQFMGRIPVKSYYELVAMLQDEEWDSLRMYLLGRHYAQTDGFTVGEADYERYIEEYVKYWRTTPEHAREIDPYGSFLFAEYANHAYDVLQQYVRELF